VTRLASSAVRIALLGLASAAGLALWAFVLEPASLRSATTRLELARWPAPCDGLRVAVLADLHVGSPFNGLTKLERIVELTAGERPDLILIAGDLVVTGVLGGRFVAPETLAPLLGRLQAPAGVFAVLGNHDWWLDGARVRAALEAAGIRVLEDASIPLRHGECAFWLAGIGDWLETRHDVAATLERVPESDAVLAFTHNPDLFPRIPLRVSLTIAGHTHGGQVYLPGLGRLVVPSRYGERFAIGHVRESGRDLFVSAGLGTSILPVRFLVPPEVSLLELRASRVEK
jgi:predicted MPP superfamily phosphohydrolase